MLLPGVESRIPLGRTKLIPVLLSISMETPRGRRWRLSIFALPVAILIAALLIVACGGGGEIRIVAITSTPTPVPTSSTPGTGGAVDATPAPAPVPLPPRPENPFAAGVQVAAYLAGGRADMENCLPELVQDWELADIEGERCLLLDLDGDGRQEFVFVIAIGSGTEPPADVWFFDDADANRRYFNSARGLANATTAAVQIRDVRDFTGDGLPDIAITWEQCGATTCVTRLIVASHQNGLLENLAPGDVAVEAMEEFEIDDSSHIRMVGGQTSTATTGPQRTRTTVVSWAGLRFRVAEEQGGPEYLIHMVNDADAAFARADYLVARQLFLAAAADTALPDWKAEMGAPSGRQELRPYSYFRAALASHRAGDNQGFLDLLDQAVEGYEGTMHGSAAAVYREAIRNGNTPEIACTAMESYVGTFQGLFNQFWNFGTANPERTVFTLCR